MREGPFSTLWRWGARHLRATVSIASARPDTLTGLRAAAATVLPLLFGELHGDPSYVWMALGGWLTTLADSGGAYRDRALTLGAFGVAGAAVTIVGAYAASHLWAAVLLLAACAIAAGLVRIYGEAASTVGTLVLIVLCIALGTPAASAFEPLVRGGLVLAGTFFAMALSLGLWPISPYGPAREAVGASFAAVGALLRNQRGLHEASATEATWLQLVASQPPQVRAALETARRTLSSVRRGRENASDRGERLVVLLELADRSLGVLMALTEALQERTVGALVGPLLEVERTFAVIAAALPRGEAPAGAPPSPLAAPPGDEAAALVRELQLIAQLAHSNAGRLGRTGPGTQQPLRGQQPEDEPLPSLREALRPGSLVFHHGLRVAIAACAALLCGSLLGLERTQWITVSTVIALQPSSGATVSRVVGRIFGTVIGASVAALLAPLLSSPLVVAAALFPLSVLAVAVRPLNYSLYSALVTPVFVLMAESLANDFALAPLRIVNTLIGAGFALLGTFFLWPRRESEQLPSYLADLLAAVRAYAADVAASQPIAALLADRRRIGLAAANADASIQRALAEPHREAEIEPAMAVLAWSRRLSGSVSALWVSGAPTAAVTSADLASLDASLAELIAAARQRRAPAVLEGPSAADPAQMARFRRQIAVLRDALARLAKAMVDEARPAKPESGDTTSPTG